MEISRVLGDVAIPLPRVVAEAERATRSAVANNSTPTAQSSGPSVEQRDAGRVATEFTAVLLKSVVKEMLDSVAEDGEGPFGSGPGSSIYRGMAETALADALAKNGLQAIAKQVEAAITQGKSSRNET